MMATSYPQHPNLQHPQQGPQQHMGHPGQPNPIAMQQHVHHPQQQQVYQQQQQQMAAMASSAGLNPQQQQQQIAAQQQALMLHRQRQQMMASGMGAGNPGGGGPGGGGVPGAGIGFGVGQPQYSSQPMNPQFQQLQQQRAAQQQQIQAVAQAQAQQQQAQQQAHLQQQANHASMQMPQQPTPMQQHPMTQQQQMQLLQQRALAQQQHAANQANAVAMPKQMVGQAILKLHQFADHLSSYDVSRTPNDIGFWKKFVQDFYAPNGVKRVNLLNSQTKEGKQFEITTHLLARYYFSLFENGVRSVQVIFEGVKEREIPTVRGTQYVTDSPRTTWIYWFDDGVHLVAHGTSRVHFDVNKQIECLDFHTQDHVEYLKRTTMNEQLQQQGSPEMMKASPGNNRLGKRPQHNPPPIPESVTNYYGVPSGVLQLLEISETISQMYDLISFSHRSGLAPKDCLRQLVNQQAQAQAQHLHALDRQQQLGQQQQQGQQGQQPHAQGMPNGIGPHPGAGGPGAGGQGMPPHVGGQVPHPGMHPGMTHSPSANEIRMGGVPSPHVSVGAATPSPAQNHMQAPAMVQQHSQHQHQISTSNPSSQTSTTVGSANTSPNQTNKRRRASTTSNVKDDDGGGPDVTAAPNGVNPAAAQATQANKVKASPRAPKRARLGAQNS